jgi:hypothetical protein
VVGQPNNSDVARETVTILPRTRIGEAGTAAKESPFRSSTAVNAPLAYVCGQPIGTFVMAQCRLNATGKCRDLARLGKFLMLGVVSLRGTKAIHPLLGIAKGEDNRRRRTPGLSATGRKREALERQRGKLVAMLAMHRMSPARRARLRQRLATVDEIIRLGQH